MAYEHQNKFILKKNPISYVNNEHPLTVSRDNHLCAGSLNVLIEGRKKRYGYSTQICSRKGYTKISENLCGDGVGDDSRNNFHDNIMTGKFDWVTSNGRFINVKHYGDNMVVSDNFKHYVQLFSDNDSKSNMEWNYTNFYDDDNQRDVLLFVNGTESDTVNLWGGGLSEVTSISGNTITVKDIGGFNTRDSDQKTVIVGCNKYDYTEIVDNQIKLVNSAGIQIGQLVASLPYKKTLSLHGNSQSYSQYDTGFLSPGLILNYQNHIIYGDKTKNTIYISHASSRKRTSGQWGFQDLSFNSPPLQNQGFYFLLDSTPTGFFHTEAGVLVSCKNNELYFFRKITEISSFADVYANWSIEKLTTGDQQAVKHQWLGRITKSMLFYISNEPDANFINVSGIGEGNNKIGNINQSVDGGLNNFGAINNSRIINVSDEIKTEFEYIETKNFWEKGRIIYYKRWTLISLPLMGRTYIYDDELEGWQPPQTLPFGAYSVKDGKLYGHSFSSDEVFEVFETYADNGSPFLKRIVSPYSDYGDSTSKKEEDMFHFSGLVSKGVRFKVAIYYDSIPTTLEIHAENKMSDIEQKREHHFYQNQSYETLGTSSQQVIIPFENLHQIHAFARIQDTNNSFYKNQIMLYTSDEDARFCIDSYGTNVSFSGESNQTNEILNININTEKK